jgi:hypothetical protein
VPVYRPELFPVLALKRFRESRSRGGYPLMTGEYEYSEDHSPTPYAPFCKGDLTLPNEPLPMVKTTYHEAEL